MIKVIGVRFDGTGKTYYFDPDTFEVKPGDFVIVDTARGPEYGKVSMGIREMADDKVSSPLKKVIRIANEKDAETNEENKRKEKEAFKICLQKIEKNGLDMKLIDVEYAFDASKIMFYFTADGRVDFRELVKDLAAAFKTRIELRQIGVRDETKMLGGIGICGRPLCCSTYLSDFAPVSIKMAKQQSLSLNPTKISGTCGRLMCCLKNEQETYEYLRGKLPYKGDIVTLPDGTVGEVSDVSVLRQTVKVLVEEDDEKEILEIPVEELRVKSRNKKKKNRNEKNGNQEKMSAEEKKALNELEKMEKKQRGAGSRSTTCRTGTGSISIRRASASGWMRSCFPAMRRSAERRGSWISEAVRGSYRSCSPRRRKVPGSKASSFWSQTFRWRRKASHTIL